MAKPTPPMTVKEWWNLRGPIMDGWDETRPPDLSLKKVPLAVIVAYCLEKARPIDFLQRIVRNPENLLIGDILLSGNRAYQITEEPFTLDGSHWQWEQTRICYPVNRPGKGDTRPHYNGADTGKRIVSLLMIQKKESAAQKTHEHLVNAMRHLIKGGEPVRAVGRIITPEWAERNLPPSGDVAEYLATLVEKGI